MFEWIFSEWFWLPPGYTWSDLEPSYEGDAKRSARDIFIYPFLIAIVLFILRNCILIPLVLTPIAKIYKVRSKPYKHPVLNIKLDKLYAINRARPPHNLLEKYAEEVGWEIRKVERWLRQKALSQQMTTMEKFNDCGWQFIYYTSYCIFGLIVIRSKYWYDDPVRSFDNFPFQDVTTDVWWYYMIAAGFYIVQTILFLQQDRKHDFYIMLTHHLCTFCILSFNWVIGFHRICAISLLFHECADIPLVFGKMFVYCGINGITNSMAVIFFVLWFITRLYLYPYWVMRTAFNIPKYVGFWWPAYGVQQVVITVLFILHLLWTKQMIPVIMTKLFSKDVIVDTRSSAEELSDCQCENHIQKETNSCPSDKNEILRLRSTGTKGFKNYTDTETSSPSRINLTPPPGPGRGF